MTWVFEGLTPLSYDVILADPPWEYELYSDAGEEKSAAAHYDTMPLSDIMRMPVGQLASRDCLLLLWVCEWMKPGDHQDLLDAWGFVYKSSIVWEKVTKNFKSRMGTGYRVRSMHERIIVATIGNPKHKPFKSLFKGVAREHSRKPEEIYDIVIQATPNVNKRLDLFSRQTRPGFDNWGKERTKFDSPEKEKKGRRRNDVAAVENEKELEPLPLLALAGDPA